MSSLVTPTWRKPESSFRNLGPPDTVHFNQCHATKHHDVAALFKFAMNMYGRVDHAIFGVGDDGSVGITVGQAEELFWSRSADQGQDGKARDRRCEHLRTLTGGFNMGDVVTASVRFARIAMAHLRSSPTGRKKRVSSYSNADARRDSSSAGEEARSES